MDIRGCCNVVLHKAQPRCTHIQINELVCLLGNKNLFEVFFGPASHKVLRDKFCHLMVVNIVEVLVMQ